MDNFKDSFNKSQYKEHEVEKMKLEGLTKDELFAEIYKLIPMDEKNAK